MQRSEELFQRGQKVIPGGVNSPVRACKSVGCDPVFIKRASGSKMWDVEGREYIDLVMSWGPMILGHTHPEVNEAVLEAVANGSSYGAPCAAEVELAEAIVDAMPGMDMVRMVNSGTEATMSALRLARGVTGRNKVVKFEGLLSRPCRRLPGQRGLRCRHLEHPGHSRRPRRHGEGHPPRPLQ